MTASLPTIPQPGPFDQLLSLRGNCAVVTGGSRGLGEATVHRLAQAGAAVVFTGRGGEALKRVEQELAATGATAVGVRADISHLDDSERVVDLAVQRFGGVDILVNNAALYTPSFALDTTEDLFDSVVGADLKGAAYASAKVGLWAATQNLAKELAPHQILVNAVTPGSTITEERLAMFRDGSFAAARVPADAAATLARLQGSLASGGFAQMLTTLMPLGHPGWPDEIAKAVLFLASDLGSYVSGANIAVDGAQSLR